MEQSVYSNGPKSRIRGALRRYFRETFRAHSRKEYAEIFTRGIGSDREGAAPYPWLYIRLLAAFIVLFSVAVLLLFVTDNILGFPHLVFFGGIMGNIPFLLLIYELYPKRDVSLIKIFSVALFGGFLSIVLAQLGYEVFIPADDWLRALWIGFWEEFTKAVPAIICLHIFKKKDPFFAFLVGVAVATGFSISEDMGYIFYYSKGFFSTVYVDQAVYMGVERSVMAICTHMPWTGLICWAYARSRRPLINFRFYLAYILSMTLHFCWDLPVDGLAEFADILCCTVAAIAIETGIIVIEKLKKPKREQLAFAAPSAINYAQLANISFSVCLVAASLLAMLCAYFNPQTVNVTKEFSEPSEFAAFMLNGITVNAVRDREYDESAEDFEYYIRDGIKISAVQRVSDGDLTYYYAYNFYESLSGEEDGGDEENGGNTVAEAVSSLSNDDAAGGGDEEPGDIADGSETVYESELSYVLVELDGALYVLRAISDADGEYIYYCSFNPDVVLFSAYGDTLFVTLNETYVQGLWESLAAGSVAAADIVIGATAFIILKLKARRYKNA